MRNRAEIKVMKRVRANNTGGWPLVRVGDFRSYKYSFLLCPASGLTRLLQNTVNHLRLTK